MLVVAGQVQCANDELTADDGERIEMTCSLQYGGSADAGWRVEWQHSESKQVLASFVDDSENSVKRSYLLVAKYKHSDGDYSCVVTSRRPPYSDNCTTRLHVLCKFAIITAELVLSYQCFLFCCIEVLENNAILYHPEDVNNQLV